MFCSKKLSTEMNFTPAPPNDFSEFIETYFERCRARVPQIEGNAGKWTHEDLIPGLSDFDTRFFVTENMTAADWCYMSTAVGQVHLDLVRERKDWARNLEHLPGVNLKWNELLDPQAYFTEFSQWSFYHGDASKLQRAREQIGRHVWNDADELYHWKKIAIYYGSYNRSIDPPVNLGAYENKYSLHSRLMHYLAPPLHSAVCLMRRETTPGKLQAFRDARELFPNPSTMDLVLELIEGHFEAPQYLEEPGISALDALLEEYLKTIVNSLLDAGRGLDCVRDATVNELKAAVKFRAGAASDVSVAQLFENIKFARLMKGRLWFYGQKVLWFDSAFLIRNELSRIRPNFYETPLRLFAKLAYQQDVSAEQALNLMQGDVLEADEVAACRRFAALAEVPQSECELKSRALAIAEIFDPFLFSLEKIMNKAQMKFN